MRLEQRCQLEEIPLRLPGTWPCSHGFITATFQPRPDVNRVRFVSEEHQIFKRSIRQHWCGSVLPCIARALATFV